MILHPLALLILSGVFMTCGTLTSDAHTGEQKPTWTSAPPPPRLNCSLPLKSESAETQSAVTDQLWYTVSRPVRGSCAQWGLPMTRWPTWFLWTWSSTLHWPRRGTRGHRHPTGRRGGQNLYGRHAALEDFSQIYSGLYSPLTGRKTSPFTTARLVGSTRSAGGKSVGCQFLVLFKFIPFFFFFVFTSL